MSLPSPKKESFQRKVIPHGKFYGAGVVHLRGVERIDCETAGSRGTYRQGDRGSGRQVGWVVAGVWRPRSCDDRGDAEQRECRSSIAGRCRGRQLQDCEDNAAADDRAGIVGAEKSWKVGLQAARRGKKVGSVILLAHGALDACRASRSEEH